MGLSWPMSVYGGLRNIKNNFDRFYMRKHKDTHKTPTKLLRKWDKMPGVPGKSLWGNLKDWKKKKQ